MAIQRHIKQLVGLFLRPANILEMGITRLGGKSPASGGGPSVATDTGGDGLSYTVGSDWDSLRGAGLFGCASPGERRSSCRTSDSGIGTIALWTRTAGTAFSACRACCCFSSATSSRRARISCLLVLKPRSASAAYRLPVSSRQSLESGSCHGHY